MVVETVPPANDLRRSTASITVAQSDPSLFPTHEYLLDACEMLRNFRRKLPPAKSRRAFTNGSDSGHPGALVHLQRDHSVTKLRE